MSCEAGNTSQALANEACAVCKRLLEDGAFDEEMYQDYVPGLF